MEVDRVARYTQLLQLLDKGEFYEAKPLIAAMATDTGDTLARQSFAKYLIEQDKLDTIIGGEGKTPPEERARCFWRSGAEAR